LSNNLLKSFLSDRTQRVKCYEYSSEDLNGTCGVPQGTVRQCLTALLLSEPTLDKLYNEANKILNTVYAWFYKNELKLNIMKSKYIYFTQQPLIILIQNNLIIHSNIL